MSIYPKKQAKNQPLVPKIFGHYDGNQPAQISVYRSVQKSNKRCHPDQGEAAWRDLSDIALREMHRSLDFARDDKVGEHLADKRQFINGGDGY